MRPTILLVALLLILTLPIAKGPLSSRATQTQPQTTVSSNILPKTSSTITAGPVAAFTYNPCVMCAVVGDMVFFNSTWSVSPNGPIMSHTWDFGDGTPLFKTTSPSASHDYPGQPGMWTVTLSVQDSTGQTDAISQSVVFNVHPSFTFQPFKPGVGVPVSFDASSTQIYSSTTTLPGFMWSFGDGTTGSGKFVAHSYAAAGLYRIILNIQTSQANAQVSETIMVGGSSTGGQNIILRSIFGIAYYNISTGQITIQPATLFLNMTLIGTNSTVRTFNVNAGEVTIGPSPTLTPARNFTSTSGQAFQSNSGRLTITAQMLEDFSCLHMQPPCTVPQATFQLFLTGPSRLVSLTSNFEFFTRLFGFLYNSQTKIGLFFIVGLAPGDVDEDGSVDITDLAIVGAAFGRDNMQTVMSQSCTASDYPTAFYIEADGNGTVSIRAIAIVGSNFGASY